MKIPNVYEVRFLTKKGGYHRWIIHIEADSLADAKNVAREMWQSDRRYAEIHQFYVEVRRVKNHEVLPNGFIHYFQRLEQN